MDSFVSNGPDGGSSSLPIHGEESSWQVSHGSPMFGGQSNTSTQTSHEASIDPKLRNNGRFNPVTVASTQRLYPSPSSQDSTARLSQSSHSRNGSQQLHSIEENVPRTLPSQNVTDETFDNAYVIFILYCNPTIQSDTDTVELRKAFRSPPKSDGKNFSTFTLFQLIQKLEFKEIKTWAQLAIELGVEPPEIGKGQSAQKVQQYAVRLKRWMHAMHVDAFFEYLLNKSHIYWTQVPSIDEPQSEFGRDGVAPEEDLALRALLPETRPKRGRRKAEDRESDGIGRSPAQRARLQSPTPSEEFTMARSSATSRNAGPSSEAQLDSGSAAPWSAIEPRVAFNGQQNGSTPTWGESQFQGLQWRSRSGHETLYTPHPQSAITPHTTDPFSAYAEEPRSAILPSKSRSRRRHGPAVSSAWPSSGNVSAGKLRGRPPSNRSVSDGPFSTFPANPNAKAGPIINLRDNTLLNTPATDNSEPQQSAFTFSPTKLSNKPVATKPSRLSLQVPQRVGGAVRLATPPPTVLVNGETVARDYTKEPPLVEYLGGVVDRPREQESLATPHRGSENTSSSATAMAGSFDLSFREEASEDRTNLDVIELMFINNVLGADWVDHHGNKIERCDLDEADQIVKQIIRNLRQESPSKETFLINLAALAGGRTLLYHMLMTRFQPDADSAHFGAKWTLKFGGVEGSFNIKIKVPLELVKKRGVDLPIGAGLQSRKWEEEERSPEDWKKRYMELHNRIAERDEKVRGLKKSVLNALVASQDFGV